MHANEEEEHVECVIVVRVVLKQIVVCRLLLCGRHDGAAVNKRLR